MSGNDLWTLFCALPTSSEDAGQLPAVAIPGRNGDYLAKTSSGEANFLLSNASPAVTKPPLRLRHIEVDYDSTCRIQTTGAASVESHFVAIKSVDVDASGLELFVRTVDALVAALPAKPRPAQTESLIAAIVELFRKLAQPPARAIKGLWAELYFIDCARETERMVSAWRGESTEKFDFVTATGYLEIKATEQTARVHEFAISQLRSERSANGLIGSLQLRRASAGVGVLDLARRISSRMTDAALKGKLWSNVVAAIGRDFAEVSDIAFDERFAQANLMLVPADRVPCIATPLPTGVLDARLVIDLTQIPRTDCLPLAELNSLFT